MIHLHYSISLILFISQLISLYVFAAEIDTPYCNCIEASFCKSPFYHKRRNAECATPGEVCCVRQSLKSLPLSCGQLPNENSSDIAWVAGVVSGGNYLGTATFVHPGVLITAAHIVQKLQPNEIQIRVQGINYHVTKILIHPRFRLRLLYNDIALVVLENHLNMGVTCLPELGDKTEGATCKFVAARQFGEMQVDRMSVLKRRACEGSLQLHNAMGPYFHLHSSFLCGLGEVPHHKASQGDGGGALLCPLNGFDGHWAHTGVATWRRTLPNVFSSVAKNIEWLDTMLSNFSPRLDKFKF